MVCPSLWIASILSFVSSALNSVYEMEAGASGPGKNRCTTRHLTRNSSRNTRQILPGGLAALPPAPPRDEVPADFLYIAQPSCRDRVCSEVQNAVVPHA